MKPENEKARVNFNIGKKSSFFFLLNPVLPMTFKKNSEILFI